MANKKQYKQAKEFIKAARTDIAAETLPFDDENLSAPVSTVEDIDRLFSA